MKTNNNQPNQATVLDYTDYIYLSDCATENVVTNIPHCVKFCRLYDPNTKTQINK